MTPEEEKIQELERRIKVLESHSSSNRGAQQQS